MSSDISGIERKKFGKRLSEARMNKQWTQAALAQEVGVSPQAIRQFEKGETWPSLPTAILLARRLGVSLDELCGLPRILPPPSKPDAQAAGAPDATVRAELAKVWAAMESLMTLLEALSMGRQIADLVMEWYGRTDYNLPSEAERYGLPKNAKAVEALLYDAPDAPEPTPNRRAKQA